MSQIDLYINNTLVPIDGTSGIRLNRVITDIREPDKKGAAWSKTIKIPGTKEVNNLFGQIFDVHHRIQGSATATTNFQPDFNPNLKATAVVLCDGIEQLRGYARLLDIPIYNQDRIIYEIGLAGDAKDLFTVLQGKRLRDLDLTDLNHDITRTNVANSWATSYKRDGIDTAFAFGEGYVYPLIDKGGLSATKKFIMGDVYPAIAAREVMLKIFEDAGYSWTSGSWFNSTTFKHIYIPYPGDSMGLTEAELTAREWKARRITTDQTMTFGDAVIMNDDSSAGYYDSATAYNTTTGEWTVPFTGKYTWNINLDITTKYNTITFGEVEIMFMLYVNGKPTRDVFVGPTYRTAVDYNWTVQGGSWEATFQQGDVVKLVLQDLYDKNFVVIPQAHLSTFKVRTGSWCNVEAVQQSHQVDELLDFSGFFDQDKTQRDFVLDFCKLANLYILPDPDQDKRLIILPRDEFYTSTILDWSKKIDLEEYQKIPLGELQDKRYLFRWTDAGDIANQGYRDRYAEQFGQYTYTVNNDFVKSDREIKIGFSPTPMINYGPAWDAVLPHIEFSDNKKAAGMRLLYYGGTKNCNAWTLADTAKSGAPSTTYQIYPFFGHVDDPVTPTIDLNFGMPREVNLHLSPTGTYTNNNFFNQFWRKQIEEITDPNSTILRGKFRLTAADWQATTMREQIFVLGEYWRINKMEDYDPENDGLVTVELIRTKTAPSFTPTSKRGRGWDTTDGYNDRFPISIKGVQVVGGTSKPINRGPNTGGIMGGTQQYTGRPDVAFLGGDGNVVLAPGVQLLNCVNCIVHANAPYSNLVNCTDLEVTETGTYFHNARVDFTPPASAKVLKYEVATNTWKAGTDLTGSGGGLVTYNFTNADSPVTITEVDGRVHIFVDATDGAVTINLPTAVGNTAIYVIKKTDSTANPVTIAPTGCTIEGDPTIAITTSGTARTITSDETNYQII
jgi:hypothetical protein